MTMATGVGQMFDEHEDVVAKIAETLRLDATAENALHSALQELQVHQIELEQQNLALHEAQQALEASRDRYATLYDFAPIGYLSLNSRGIIRDINLTGAALFGQERGNLIGHPMANHLASGCSRELFDFLRRAMLPEDHVTAELELATADTDRPRAVRLDGVTVKGHEGEPTCLTSLVDITDSRAMERELQSNHAELSSILNVAPIGIGLVRNRTFQWLNPRFLEIVGYAEHELIGSSSCMVYQDEQEYNRVGIEKYEQIAATGSGQVETRFRCKDGRIRDILLRSTLLDRANPNHGTIFTALDITERKQAEKRLHLARNVLENASEGIMVTDPSLRIVEVNPAFSTITGYSAKDVLGRGPKILSSGRHDKDFYRSMWQQLQSRGKWEGEVWNRRKSGETFPEWITITRICDPAGEVCHYACIFTDISNQMHIRERLHRLAYFDALTELPNRELFRDRFEVLVNQARRHRQSVALLFLDLDHFKDVNDTQGHLFGDALLKEVAVRLRTCVRETDGLARLGGDEFTVLVSELQHPDDVEAVALKIQRTLEAPFVIDNKELFLTTSIGISIFPNDSENIDTLITQADNAMYSAKNAGRGTHCFFHSGLSERTLERMFIVNRLRRAIDKDNVHVYYQPQMSLRTGRISCLEALARLEQPQSGTMAPGKFIPVAEETGQIVALSERILLRAINNWMEQLSVIHDDLVPRLSVNISSVQFRKQDVYTFVASMLERTGMPASKLEIELTETVLMQDTKKVSEVLSALDRLGVRIAIDDFGTGYSSLNYLAQFPIHTVKIDCSFTRSILAGDKKMFLVATVIGMSRVLDFDVVAEGVETVGQLALLHELGCDRIQGNLISCPKKASEIATWIRQRENCADLSH